MVMLFPMAAGVPVLGVVTAADIPTSEASPQMDPGIAHLDALLANL